MVAIFRRFAPPSTVDAVNEAFVQSNARIIRWYMLLLQLAGNAFLCGIFGTISGLLAVKIFRGKRSSVGFSA
jgi:hypothetical protein